MKTIYLLKSIALLAIAIGVSSCSQKELPESKSETTNEYVEVSLKCASTITDVEVSPLSRADSEEQNDLYLIKALEYHEADGQQLYLPHAYGLFQGKDNITPIRLKKDRTYILEATMVENGANVIYHEDFSGITGYYKPFMCLLENSFTYYDNAFTANDIYYGTADVYGEDGQEITYYYPAINRHFGVSDNFIAKEGINITIDMAPMMFGLKVVAENLTEGYIKVQQEGAPEIILHSGEESKTEYLSLYYLTDWYWGNYKEEGKDIKEYETVRVSWIDAQGQEHFIGEKDIYYQRNKIKTIRIFVSPNATQGNSNISTDYNI